MSDAANDKAPPPPPDPGNRGRSRRSRSNPTPTHAAAPDGVDQIRGDEPSAEPLGRSLELLGRVRSGAAAGSLLAPADRQALVSLLAADGLATPEIAQILQVADRTIERDRRAIRAGLAIAKDPKLVEQMVGRLMAEAELSVQRIRRTAREREVEPAVKVDAEHRCFQIVRDLVQSLQKLGYLPTATQKLEADLTHHVGELPSLGDLQAEIERLKSVQGGIGADADPSQFIDVEQVIERAALASRVKDLSTDRTSSINLTPGDLP